MCAVNMPERKAENCAGVGRKIGLVGCIEAWTSSSATKSQNGMYQGYRYQFLLATFVASGWVTWSMKTPMTGLIRLPAIRLSSTFTSAPIPGLA